jgi:tripartite-type tricarboxylate transporter receptor subunit TctC
MVPRIHSQRLALRALCALFSALFFATPPVTHAQTWPNKPLKWVVPVAAGGPIDVLTRAIAQPVSASLGQPVVVEVRASVSGTTGAESVAKAASDGYTLLSHANMVPQRFLYRSLPYDYTRDFTHITLFARSAMMLYVHESVPAKNLAELLALLKAQPGKLAYGSSGVGQPFHLAMEMLKQRTGTDVLHVPYKGIAQVIPDFLAGRVQLIFFNPVEQLLSQVKTGKLRALAITGDKRLPDMPGVATFEELGVRDFDPAGYVAVSTTAGVPRDVVDRLNREVVRAVALPEVARVYDRFNMIPGTTTPEQFEQIIRADLERWGPLIRGLGITLE